MAKKKTTRFTLRLPEELDQQLEQIGKDLGLNKTSLIHYLIHKSLPDLQLDALLYRKQVQEGKMVPLFLAWMEAHPRRQPREFLSEYLRHLRGEASSLDGLEPKPWPAEEGAGPATNA